MELNYLFLDKDTFSGRQLGQVGLLLQECMFL